MVRLNRVIARARDGDRGRRSNPTIGRESAAFLPYKWTAEIRPILGRLCQYFLLRQHQYESVGRCEFPAGCRTEATHRVVVKLSGGSVETYEYYCRRHAAVAERAARRDPRFELVRVEQY